MVLKNVNAHLRASELILNSLASHTKSQKTEWLVPKVPNQMIPGFKTSNTDNACSVKESTYRTNAIRNKPHVNGTIFVKRMADALSVSESIQVTKPVHRNIDVRIAKEHTQRSCVSELVPQ